MFKTTLRISFLNKQQSSYAGSAKLTIELPFIPTCGITFSCSAWRDERKPHQVVFNIETGQFEVAFPTEEFDTTSETKDTKDFYASNGWNVTGVASAQ